MTIQNFKQAAIDSGTCTDISEIVDNSFGFVNAGQQNTVSVVPADASINADHIHNTVYQDGNPVVSMHYTMNNKGLKAFANRLG